MQAPGGLTGAFLMPVQAGQQQERHVVLAGTRGVPNRGEQGIGRRFRIAVRRGEMPLDVFLGEGLDPVAGNQQALIRPEAA